MELSTFPRISRINFHFNGITKAVPLLALQCGDIYEANPLENRQIYEMPLNLWRQFTPKVVVYRQTNIHTPFAIACVRLNSHFVSRQRWILVDKSGKREVTVCVSNVLNEHLSVYITVD